MSDQYVDETDIITGWCNNGSGVNCPPGTEWGCCEIESEFPIFIPGIDTCEVAAASYQLRYARSIQYPEYYVRGYYKTEGPIHVVDNSGNVLAGIDGSGGKYGRGVILNRKLYTFRFGGGSSVWKFYETDIETNVTTLIRDQSVGYVEGPHNGSYVGLMTTDGARICISCSYRVNGVYANGAYICNTLGEYVGHISAPADSHVTLLNNHYLVGHSSFGLVKIYDIDYNYIGDLNTPDATAEIGCNIQDLGIYEGIGRIAVCDYSRVLLYDYNFTLLKIIISPFGATGRLGSYVSPATGNDKHWGYQSSLYFSNAIMRHGNFIAIGEGNLNVAGLTTGGILYFNLDGEFVNMVTSPNWNLLSNGQRIGSCVFFTDKFIYGYSTSPWGTKGIKCTFKEETP